GVKAPALVSDVVEDLMHEVVGGMDSHFERSVAVPLTQNGGPAAQAHPVGSKSRTRIIGLPALGQRIGVLITEVAVRECLLAVFLKHASLDQRKHPVSDQGGRESRIGIEPGSIGQDVPVIAPIGGMQVYEEIRVPALDQ